MFNMIFWSSDSILFTIEDCICMGFGVLLPPLLTVSFHTEGGVEGETVKDV